MVASDKGDKTIKVVVNYQTMHAKYGKYLKRRTVLHAHDEKIPCSESDSLPIDCWKQPIRIWALATDRGIVVCYSAMGIPPEGA